MQTIPLYPLLLDPALHVKVWGGRRLETVLHKSLPTDEPYGESWEMHDTATVANGELAGRTLGDLLPVYGAALVGEGNDPALGFPLLAKFLDATDWLSVQVHPNDAQAQQFEGEPRGKTETWYVLASEPDSQLVIGVQPGTTREAMAQAIRDSTLEDLLVFVKIGIGDVLSLPAGTVHALGPGLLIYEIQQSSDITYRLYDWGRVDLNGQPRTLHIDKGVAVSNLDRLPEIKRTADDPSEVIDVVTSPYFRTLLHRLDGGEAALKTSGRFHILTCIDGSVIISTVDNQVALDMGQTALIPAALGAYHLRGAGKVLRSFQP